MARTQKAKDLAPVLLAEQHRPKTFEEYLGQDGVVDVLKGMFKTGRLRQMMLFSGTTSSGKTTMARILARVLVCENIDRENARHCGECRSCKIPLAQHPSVIEINAADARTIDATRTLVRQLNLAPTMGKRKVYIIDECHQLTREAWNTALKPFENPHPHVHVILCSSEPDKIIAAMPNRCMQFNLESMSVKNLARLVYRTSRAEGYPFPKAACLMIANRVRGQARGALVLVEQIILGMEGAGVGIEAFTPEVAEKIIPDVLGKLTDMAPVAILEDYARAMFACNFAEISRLVSVSPIKARSLLPDLINLVRNTIRAMAGGKADLSCRESVAKIVKQHGKDITPDGLVLAHTALVDGLQKAIAFAVPEHILLVDTLFRASLELGVSS